MADKRSTIKDVALRANVSTATASHVINNTKFVNADLRAKVEAAAKELSYSVDRAASRLRSGQTRIIGVLVPDLEDAFFTALVSRLEVLAGEHGYEVIVASSRNCPEIEESRLRALLGWRPTGFVIVPCSNNVPKVIADEAKRLPIVLADRVSPTYKAVDTVTIDNFEAGEIVARYLVSNGHRDILVAASSLSISPISERVRGVDAYMKATLGHAPTVVEVGSSSNDAADVLERWLERNILPTAIFGLTNVTTLAALSALANRQIAIPRQVSLVGFDDYAWMSARMTPLTAIRQPVDTIAETVWTRLMSRLSNQADKPSRIELTTTLQIRESVRNLITKPIKKVSSSLPKRAKRSASSKKSIH